MALASTCAPRREGFSPACEIRSERRKGNELEACAQESRSRRTPMIDKEPVMNMPRGRLFLLIRLFRRGLRARAAFALAGVLALLFVTLAGPRAAPALWRFSDEDSTVHLFGTIHMLKGDVEWRDPELDGILKQADDFVFELAAGETDPAKMRKLVMARGFLPPQQNLWTLLPPPLADELKKTLDGFGLPMTAVARMRPWYVGLQLTVLAARRVGFAPEQGVDLVLMQQAREKARPVIGLEAAAEQLDLFAGLPNAAQIAFLKASLQDIADIGELIDRLQRYWLAGEVEELAALVNEGLEADPQLAERLLHARNRRWAPKIASLLARPGQHFVAVGAGHLAGRGNLRELLAGQGITVVRAR
ncbi:MAG: TraB/GumN family protein [Alphaproteobacteria bacterium]|nr:MAG: TraB/GumN family protein [Alphaproteobacteria bacterium]